MQVLRNLSYAAAVAISLGVAGCGEQLDESAPTARRQASSHEDFTDPRGDDPVRAAMPPSDELSADDPALQEDRLRRLEERLAAHVEAIQESPADPALRRDYIRDLLLSGRHEEAIKGIQTCLAENIGDKASLYLSLATAYKQAGDLDRELAARSMAIDLTAEEPIEDLYLSRGDIYMIKQEYELAFADYSKELNLFPRSYTAQLRHGKAALLSARYEVAIGDAESISQHTGLPSQIRAYGYALLAEILATTPDDKLRNGKDALWAAESAAATWRIHHGELEPDFEISLAAAHAETGDFEAAVAHQRKALEKLKSEKHVSPRLYEQLKCYQAGKPYRVLKPHGK